jgi:hypothetical protein
MPTVECFEDLRVWQEAREIVNVVYKLTRRFPPFKGPKLREPGPEWQIEEPET